MEIKEPAVIFSETGWKLFLEAVYQTKIQDCPSEEDSTENDAVNKLVKEYNQYKKEKSDSKKESNPSDMDEITAQLTSFMEDGEIKTSKDIITYINDVCGYEYKTRAISPLMRAIMIRNPNIVKLNKKEYQLRMDSEEVMNDE